MLEVVFHPRDEKGQLAIPEDGEYTSPAEQLRRLARGKGWPEWMVERWVRQATEGNGHAG